MKNPILYITIIAAFVLTGCSKQNGTDTTAGTGTVDTASAMLRYSGSFVNGPYGSVSGDAKIFLQNGSYILKFQGVNISNGPDLHVYLSKEVQPVNFIDLGRLQSTSGNQVYSITGTPDFTQYKYALVHCQRFNHLFGSAELQ
jgi:Electron transfer DM13